jgi:hypothetical protein
MYVRPFFVRLCPYRAPARQDGCNFLRSFHSLRHNSHLAGTTRLELATPNVRMIFPQGKIICDVADEGELILISHDFL